MLIQHGEVSSSFVSLETIGNEKINQDSEEEFEVDFKDL